MFRSSVPLTVEHAGVGCYPKVKRFKGDKGRHYKDTIEQMISAGFKTHPA